ncbi:hypothetical protein GPECTOR_1g52 [Gonium pectorale]|uniref:Histone deacetylase domain-containing protein n=1 Tax=Gonium pectorale TaxID=33097 RepID=A0A150H427_GONPE|nr:hypothetical protein GPECTOR_1g52 [Gonium pectorale]|eukprot:KXZ56578.1 hypothetical protein GPECTOR_1g52 [Gonium pectorale]
MGDSNAASPAAADAPAPELSKFSLGEDHPMVPHRLHLTHRLSELWGLFDDPAVTVVDNYPPATPEQLRRFHTDEYIAFLEYLDTLDLGSMSVEEQQELFGDDLALFGLSVCRPPGEGKAEEEEEAAAAAAAAAGEGGEEGKAGASGAEGANGSIKAEPGAGGDAATAARQQQYDAMQQHQLQQQKQQQVKAELAARAAAAKATAKAEAKAVAPPAPNLNDIVVPPQLVQLATQILFKLAPMGSNQLTPAQQQQLLMYLRQQQLQLQQRHAQLVGQAAGPGRAYGSGNGARPAVTMVRPGQAPGGGGGGKKRKAEGGKGGKKKSRRRRSSYSDDDEEEEEMSDDDDGGAAKAEGGEGAAAGEGGEGATVAAGGRGTARRAAATAVAALTNAAAGSIQAARDLASGACDVAVHWGGGMHHGMPYRAFGFCYVNDLVLAVLELMAVCGRVLYIDIDVHHGDGVETAFKKSEKVLSISLHKWDDGRMQASIDTLNHGKPQRPVFFPGTGKKNDLGEGQGKYFTVNVPLQDDITDESYFHVYKAVVQTAFDRFKPQAVVLQCGCDSVAGDKLGRFNLSIRGHARCVELVRDLCRSGGNPNGPANPNAKWKVPLLVTGGGGYTPPLVARCWTLETAVLLGKELGEEMPPAVAASPDLADLGPSYFKEPGLSRPPRGPFHMCLDTILLPGLHKQMDSDYSLSRLGAYLTSNMQRINIKEPGAQAAAGDAAGKDGDAKDAAKDGKEGGKEAAADAKPPPKSRSRKSNAGPGVHDPLKHLTAPVGYPDAEEYIQDQKERVAAGAPWAAKMPPPPVPKGRKSGAGAGGSGGKKEEKAAGDATKPAAGGKKEADKGSKKEKEAAAAAAAAEPAAAAPHVPGLPTIMPYKPKTEAAAPASQ